MKILFFIESLHSGGKERRLTELIKGLLLYDQFEIELVTTKKDINYKEILDMDVKIHYLLRKKSRDPKVFIQFFKIAWRFKPDFIHVWGRMVAIYAIPTKLLLNIPMINSEITDAPPNILPPEPSLKLTFKFSDILLSNSLAGLKAYNAPKEKSKVIYNGFDFNRIENLIEKKIIRDQFKITTRYVVAMVATFSSKKDYTTFIEAAKLVLSEKDDVSFLCVGDGDFSKYFEMVPNTMKNKILFLGKQKDVESIMNICDLGVLTSNSDEHGEGISNALMEFMAFKKPVIANDNGGNIELVANNVNGYIIKDKDFIDLSRKVRNLLQDDELRARMGIESFRRINKNFHIENMIKGFKEIYDKYE
ncbi:glycosyltransferase [Lutimonas saemankumensis]|uniref:glycosyltransferase n=1 Tax=Lutimonas saemankumensis TaxID=483016 RepID=UPI001CD44287|nr:glycosyltransferase [Lutimonas saemankumensis]MCA0931063.1 glycosyltransferase [Lutimonas saemankumensis]